MQLRTPKDVGAAIRQRRRELHLDQRTLAERVGVSRQWISECERGKPRAELGLVLRAIRVLGLDLRIGAESVAVPPLAHTNGTSSAPS
ncbi:helix-turn-helix domain-containing protein [Pendulispora brunnea]|uniref:Helix-turn-helix domain-containing protein n=1 Tax=Pendulispora brunnea TaxID=2905690 RepID=A0ABZ2KMC6_9BACT